MKLKLLIVASFSCLFSVFSHAQSSIKGMLIETGGGPVSYANVLLFDPIDTSLVKGQVSSGEGLFIITDVADGNYLLSVSMIGFAQHNTALSVDQSVSLSINLETITLDEDTKILDGVVIEAHKPLFELQTDKMVVNVQQSIIASAGTVIDVLEKTPGIGVNRQNNNLTLNGKAGVQVLVNGKMGNMATHVVMEMLAGMNAGNVDRIEVMTNPPAKYDAEGDAGIINIIMLKSEDKGLNGSFDIRAGYGTREKTGTGLSFNYRNKKINLFGTYSNLYDHQIQTFNSTRGHLTNTDSSSYFENLAKRPNITYTQNGTAGMDYYLGSNTILGLNMTYSTRLWDMLATTDFKRINSYTTDEYSKQTIHELNQRRSVFGNINFKHSFVNNHQVSADLDYLHNKLINPTEYIISNVDEVGAPIDTYEMKFHKNTPIGLWVGKFDYAGNIFEHIKLETGIKYTISHFQNDVMLENTLNGAWNIVPEFTSNAMADEEVMAAYSSFSWKSGNGLEASGGARFEQTAYSFTTTDHSKDFSRSYGNFFPSLFLSKQFNKKIPTTVQISYSRRINRPTFNELAPFTYFNDPYTAITGNDALQPGLADIFKTDIKIGTVLMSVQYSLEKQAIAQFMPINNSTDGTSILSSQNLDHANSFSTNMSFPLTITDWWETQQIISFSSLQINSDQPNSTEGVFEFTQKAVHAGITHSFTLPKNFNLEISSQYFSPGVLFYIYKRPAREVLNIGLEKKFKNSTLRLSGNDLFHKNLEYTTVKDPELNLDSTFYITFDTRSVWISYSRSFGNDKLKNKRNRKNSSQEEQNRLTN